MPITINRALNYNEQKVQKGKAKCIGEGNILLPASCMNFYQKLDVFESRNKLNERAQTKTIHISLNFDPSENHSTQKLNLIAAAYMDRIGFGEQPYLIYQHHDAGHPHIHIVSTTIRSDGSRIPTHNIGRNVSEPARKEIEEIFALVPASKQEKTKEYILQPIDIEVAHYGYSETRRSIANITSQVLDNYNIISLPAFNAVLKQFNVIADEGKENGIIRKHKGLQYRLLDESGNKIGVPIKASSLPSQPTLVTLEKKFATNRKNRDRHVQSLKDILDQTLKKKPIRMSQLTALLLEKKVVTVLRTNAEGRTYGITYVDHLNKAVINGSELGKEYSIAGLKKQFNQTIKQLPKGTSILNLLTTEKSLQTDLLDSLLHPDWEAEQTPYELRKRKKKENDNH